MEIVHGGVAFLGLLFSTILAMLALWGRISKWLEKQEKEREDRVKQLLFDVMTDRGLIKQGQREKIWPNGSDNMVDFLVTLWETMEATQAGLHALQAKMEEGSSKWRTD